MINKLIVDTLKTFNIPVSFQKYSGNAETYITFFDFLEKGESYADDSEKGVGHYIQVDIWSKGDYSTLNEQVVTILKSIGFQRISSQDLYESDTQIYHKGIRFFYLISNE